MRFRKKPVEVEAIKTSDAVRCFNHAMEEMPEWLRAAYKDGRAVFTQAGVRLQTLEGVIMAKPNDWIIKGIWGELYPCANGIFKESYDPVQ